VLLTSRALGAGWSRSPLSRRLCSEGWTRVRNGAWIEPGRRADTRVRLKATQMLEPRLVVSHRSAARIWRIEVLGPGAGAQTHRPEMEFTDPELTSRQHGPGVRVHRIPVAETDVVQHSGLRVTDVPRTLADLLRAGPRDDALVAVESALGYRTVDGVRRPNPLRSRQRLVILFPAPSAKAQVSETRRATNSPLAPSPQLRLHHLAARVSW